MTIIGYARVSTSDQSLEIQEAALKAAGSGVIRAEKRSGTTTSGRAELQTVLDFLGAGDVLMVTRIDRLARSTSHGLRKAAATRLADRGATTTQLMAWFGWKTASEAERYTRNADRKHAAATAGKLISGTGIGKSEIQFAKNDSK
jgi:hypothetical protein